jgi:hypothetical protein
MKDLTWIRNANKIMHTGSSMKGKAINDVCLDTLETQNDACSHKRNALLKLLVKNNNRKINPTISGAIQ